MAIGADDAFGGGTGRSRALADGVRASLKGCAAAVEVAAGGLCDEEGEPCRGAAWVAAFGERVAGVLLVDERFLLAICDTLLATIVGSLLRRTAARMHRLQFIFLLLAVECDGWNGNKLYSRWRIWTLRTKVQGLAVGPGLCAPAHLCMCCS